MLNLDCRMTQGKEKRLVIRANKVYLQRKRKGRIITDDILVSS